MTLDHLQPLVQTIYPQVASDITSRRIRLPAGDALEVSYKLNAAPRQRGVVWFVVADGATFALAATCVVGADDAAECLRDARAMAQTLRFE